MLTTRMAVTHDYLNESINLTCTCLNEDLDCKQIALIFTAARVYPNNNASDKRK